MSNNLRTNYILKDPILEPRTIEFKKQVVKPVAFTITPKNGPVVRVGYVNQESDRTQDNNNDDYNDEDYEEEDYEDEEYDEDDEQYQEEDYDEEYYSQEEEDLADGRPVKKQKYNEEPEVRQDRERKLYNDQQFQNDDYDEEYDENGNYNEDYDDDYYEDENYDDDYQNDDRGQMKFGRVKESPRSPSEEQKMTPQRVLSDAAFRMLNFQVRTIIPDLPRNVVQRTYRDEHGKHIPHEMKLIKKQSVQDKLANFKREELEEGEVEVNYDLPLRKCNWQGYSFTDDMACDEDYRNARGDLRSYSDRFEVENGQYKKELLIKPFQRSNQGKESEEFRSLIGLSKAMNRISHIISTNYDFFEVFNYVHDRYRAIRIDLTQIASKNNIDRDSIPILEIMARFYLYSYFEMLKLKEEDRVKDNIIQCKKQINKLLANIIESYISLFRTDNTEVFRNAPEFISYQLIYFMLSLKPYKEENPSYGQYSELMSILCQQCPFYSQLMMTKQMQITQILQEVITTNNYSKLYLVQQQDLDFYQSLCVVLVAEIGNQSDLMGKKCFHSEIVELVPDTGDMLVDIQNKHLSKYNAVKRILNKQGDFLLSDQQEWKFTVVEPIFQIIHSRKPSYVYSQEEQYEQQYDDAQEQEYSDYGPEEQYQNHNEDYYDSYYEEHSLEIIDENIRTLADQLVFKHQLKGILKFSKILQRKRGQFYYFKRTFMHWKTSIQKTKQIYKESLERLKHFQINQKSSFSFIKHLAQLSNKLSIFKVVIISSLNKGSIINKLQYSLLEQTIFKENIQLNVQFNQDSMLKISLLSIDTLNETILRGCNLVIYIIEGEINIKNYQGNILFIQQCKQSIKQSKYLELLAINNNLNLQNIKMVKWSKIYDNFDLFHNEKFRNKIIQLTKIQQIDYNVFAVSFDQIIADIIQQFKQCDGHIRTFIYLCMFTDDCIKDLELNRIKEIYPEEVLFDRFLNHSDKIPSLMDKLMKPMHDRMKQQPTVFDMCQVIEKFLGFIPQEIIDLTSRFNDNTGPWRELVIAVLKNWQVKRDFVLPIGFKLSLAEDLDLRVQSELNSDYNLFDYKLLSWLRSR